jgi:hypothetical protein
MLYNIHVFITPAYAKVKTLRLPDQARSERGDMCVRSVMIPCNFKNEE